MIVRKVYVLVDSPIHHFAKEEPLAVAFSNLDSETNPNLNQLFEQKIMILPLWLAGSCPSPYGPMRRDSLIRTLPELTRTWNAFTGSDFSQ